MKKSKYLTITAAVLIAIAAAPSQARQNNHHRAHPSGLWLQPKFQCLECGSAWRRSWSRDWCW